MKTIRIISVEEQNEFANPALAYNGGGYEQPYIIFEYDGKEGYYSDTSCGDFGSRWGVSYDGKCCDVDNVGCYQRYTEFTHSDQEFAQAFYEEFGRRILHRKFDKGDERMSKLILALCDGRHEMPSEVQGAMFSGMLNPLDIEGMRSTALSVLEGVESLDLYVTGLTVALVEVINACHELGVELTLYHYDRVSGDYYPQKVTGRK